MQANAKNAERRGGEPVNNQLKVVTDCRLHSAFLCVLCVSAFVCLFCCIAPVWG
jgi:hypothetical protein